MVYHTFLIPPNTQQHLLSMNIVFWHCWFTWQYQCFLSLGDVFQQHFFKIQATKQSFAHMLFVGSEPDIFDVKKNVIVQVNSPSNTEYCSLLLLCLLLQQLNSFSFTSVNIIIVTPSHIKQWKFSLTPNKTLQTNKAFHFSRNSRKLHLKLRKSLQYYMWLVRSMFHSSLVFYDFTLLP